LQSLGAEPEKSAAVAEEPVAGDAAYRLVLPKILRKPARLVARLEGRLPRHVGLKGTALLFAATAISGTLVGGHVLTIVSALTAWSGLAIDQIKITGQSETSEVDVLETMGIGEYPSILTFDADTARQKLESLPWVETATIRKLYPDTLRVALVERQPFAIWQDGSKVALIDKSGYRITPTIGERYAKLPMVVGKGADKRVGEFVALIEGVPSLKSRIKAGVLVSKRRWNVVLDSGLEVLLPEVDPGDALVQVVALDDGHGILSREIAAIDLRLGNRLVFRLTEEGAKARAALLKEREKAAKGKGNA
jgi:cell division protein FtsQ